MWISVYDILSWLASGMTKQYILKDFPELTEEDIQAALSYRQTGSTKSSSPLEAPVRLEHILQGGRQAAA